VSLKLEEVVPWGRSMWEYAHMFDLAMPRFGSTSATAG
jgi:hypothetical protein